MRPHITHPPWALLFLERLVSAAGVDFSGISHSLHWPHCSPIHHLSYDQLTPSLLRVYINTVQQLLILCKRERERIKPRPPSPSHSRLRLWVLGLKPGQPGLSSGMRGGEYSAYVPATVLCLFLYRSLSITPPSIWYKDHHKQIRVLDR